MLARGNLLDSRMHAAPFATIVLVSCASALQLPAQGRPRLVPLLRSDCSGSGGGLRVRSGPISCKTTDEDWARRWPNATPEELANMKKWCAAGPISAQGLGGHTLTAPQHRSTALHHCACCTRVRGRAAPAPVGCTGDAGTQPGQLHVHLTDTACAHAFKCTRSTLGLTLTRTRTLHPDPNPNTNQGQGA